MFRGAALSLDVVGLGEGRARGGSDTACHPGLRTLRLAEWCCQSSCMTYTLYDFFPLLSCSRFTLESTRCRKGELLPALSSVSSVR